MTLFFCNDVGCAVSSGPSGRGGGGEGRGGGGGGGGSALRDYLSQWRFL